MKIKYDIMNCEFKGGIRHLKVFNFEEGGIYTFTLNEVDQLPEDLQAYVKTIEEDVKQGKFDYRG
ncbi:hypothetical protein Q9251_03110 [Alkalihalobacillus macyae]|uniref:hypothetical protein n=1 Tax=Guptibacillus hwajinpoensis TaxID=208199 RepID=UPI00273CB082|nr:hypothetical protein [Alkalihalobacillus macyae]MDP4549865.1 hypothetical protein [Alkalihalobacillus macyae]